MPMRNKGWGLFSIQDKKRLFIYLDKLKKISQNTYGQVSPSTAHFFTVYSRV